MAADSLVNHPPSVCAFEIAACGSLPPGRQLSQTSVSGSALARTRVWSPILWRITRREGGRDAWRVADSAVQQLIHLNLERLAIADEHR